MNTYEQMILSQNKAMQGYLFIVLFCFMIAFIFHKVSSRRPDKKKFNVPTLSLEASLFLGAFLRLPNMLDSFWYDETFTAMIASLPITKAMIVILSDVHPPLAYAPFWLIGQLSDNEVILRIPSLLTGILIIYICYLIGQYWSEDTARHSALISAIMPSLIWYSNEARAYSILTLLVLLAVYGLLFKRNKIFYISLALLPLIHAYGFFYAFFIGTAYIYKYKITLKTALHLGLSAIPALLWLPFMLNQTSDVLDGFWLSAPSAGTALYFITEMTISTAYPSYIAIVVIPTLLITLPLAFWHNRDSKIILYLFFSVPIFAFILSHIWTPIYLNRALLPVASLIVFIYARWIPKAPRLSLAMLSIIVVIIGFKINPDAQRIQTNDYVAHCDNMPIYAIGLESAIIASYYSNQQIYIYTEPNNLNQSLPYHARSQLNFTERSIAPLDTCIYWQDSPMTTQAQRDNLRLSIALRDSYEQTTLLDTNNLIIEVYK